MSCVSMWNKMDLNKLMATYCIEKYVHQLKWTGYKENILEVGCGDGSITNNILYPQIQTYVGKLLATDKLEGMIDFAKKANKIEEIDYRVLDVLDSRATRRYQNQFDRIFALLVAQLIPDNRRFFIALRDMLKPSGQIFVTIIPDSFVIRSVRKQFAEEKWKRYARENQIFADYTDDTEKYLRELLRDVGFECDVYEDQFEYYTTDNFEGIVDLYRLIRALLYLYVGLGAGSVVIQEDFVQEMIEKCAAECTYLGEANKYEMPHPQTICIATKIT